MEKVQKTKLPSPKERMDLILLGLSRAQPVEELCRQAGVSRELFYRWMKRVREAGEKSLEPKAPGPKLELPDAPEKALRMLQERIEKQDAKNRKLHRERKHLEEVVKVARRIILRRAWGPNPARDSKKNGMQQLKPEKSTSRNGKRNKNVAAAPAPLPKALESLASRTGAG